MSGKPSIPKERRIPKRKEAVVFREKTALLQARRFLRDRASSKVARFSAAEGLKDVPVIARSITPLWTEAEPQERALVAGKIQNLRIAIGCVDGVEVPAGEIFSFWRHVGRATRRRGFVEGRELREGCIIPNIGGGLCQISNALFDVAAQAGFEIVERHRHTQIVAGSLAESGRDATVFWNYVDLRFRSASPFRISARMDSENLTVEIRGEKVETKTLHQINGSNAKPEHIGSCATCQVDDCHRVVTRSETKNFGSAAWLVDEYSPEFDDYVQRERSAYDLLCIPIDGKRFRKGNYAWNSGGFLTVKQSLFVTLLRSYRSRRLAAQGAARQKNLLAMYEALAESYARRLTFDTLHITVHQNLLPYLWKSGHLGGRTFDVLMTALPMAELQGRLDLAARSHPQSETLGDFRADAELVFAEAEALNHARKIITPHSDIASYFGDRAEKIDWRMPEAGRLEAKAVNEKPVVVFPSSTVGRKGCYELREAIRGLNLKLIILGPSVEGAEFWEGFEVERGGDDWLSRADLVVLPAFVEHRPRRLLAAAGAGIPVIASAACGVSNVPGVHVLKSPENAELYGAIRSTLRIDQPPRI